MLIWAFEKVGLTIQAVITFYRFALLLMLHNRSFSKTRIAPTPTGFLHAGNALNFLLTAALATHYHATLLLRIDDLDRSRYRMAYAEDIFETLAFLNIKWHEGPQRVADVEQTWSQQHRALLYDEVLKKLRDSNKLFACVCSRTQCCNCQNKDFSLDAPNTSWRLVTDDAPVSVRTLDGNSITAPLPAEMKDFIVRKKDGMPSYQLSSVADDLHFGVDLIVRGDDLWPSTLAQHYLAKQLDEDLFSAICFYHHPLLKNDRSEKLSKSAGAASLKHWRESGKSLAGFLAYLGTLLHLPQPLKSATELIPALGA